MHVQAVRATTYNQWGRDSKEELRKSTTHCPIDTVCNCFTSTQGELTMLFCTVYTYIHVLCMSHVFDMQCEVPSCQWSTSGQNV